MIRQIAAAALLATVTSIGAGSVSAAEPLARGAELQHVQDRGRDWDRGRWDRNEGDYRPGRHWDRLSEREIRSVLRRAGYHEIRILDRDRRTYTVRAENRRGRDFIVTMNAYNGRILHVRPTRWR